MKVSRDGSNILVEGDTYTLKYDSSRSAYVDLRFACGVGAELFVASGCDRDEMIDELVSLGAPQVSESAEEVELTFPGKTTLWRKAEYTFTCRPEEVLYGYRVHGAGRLDNARFFEGFLADDPRMEEAFCPWFPGGLRHEVYHRPLKQFMQSSVPRFDLLHSFTINTSDTRRFMYYETTTIRVNGDRFYLGGDWLVTPPPFLYLMGRRDEKDWVSMGLVVDAGENNFLEYQYSGGEGFGLNLTYDGYTKVDGAWQSPRILLTRTAGDVYEALGKYVDFLRAGGYVKINDRSSAPRWWYEPIFGGWGEQMFFSDNWDVYRGIKSKRGSGSIADTCTRAAYSKMLDQLVEKGIHPTILIVDNRWFKTDVQLDVDEQLWPDMAGFISRQHEEGRKVILWVSPWDYCRSAAGADVPLAEHAALEVKKPYELEIDTDVFYKVFNREKRKVRRELKVKRVTAEWRFFVDPLNADYEKRLRAKIDYLLSPEGLDADGFEFDYTHFLPIYRDVAPITPHDETLWGVELMHRLMWIYYDQAKKSKPDSLIISHIFNPYFDDVVDMLRLQDIYTDRKSIVAQMDHRARVASLVSPGCAIHTDQHPMPSLYAWREYAKYQPAIGNPCLYYVTGIETTEERLTDEDFAMLRKVWGEYHKKLDEKYGPKR